MSLPEFDEQFRSRLRDLFIWRRDVRHFKQRPLPDGTLERLIDVARLAPSVGLSEPWRFVVVSDPSKRLAVRRCFESCNKTALAAQSTDDAGLYARLKLAGLEEAPGHIAVFADRATTQGKGLGRHTMPETIEYSSVMAIHTLWLVARAEGMGVGWVSILEPREIQEILATPAHWKFVSYLCVGYPESERDIPVLESEGWEKRRRSSDDFILYR